MGTRYEIRPGSTKPGQSRYATHAEVLLALKATAKELGLVAKLPAARGEGWRASIQGLTVEGHTKRVDDHSLEVFHVQGPCDQAKLFTFAEHVAAIAGKQAIIGDTDDEFWFVDQPAKSTTKKKKKAKR
ncbi:MAG TPA: hypothetical protein VL326_20670 [Kofleriaceae bacterium]|jgi:hypothetical protein|nr:hypothetical protein [Kofleriaceae bacterium]